MERTLTFHATVISMGLALSPGSSLAARGVAGTVTAPDGTQPGRQWLLVIGIDKYQHLRAWPQLDCAVKDAQALRDVLVRRYHFDEVVEFYDEQATLAVIVEKLRWLVENTAESDSLLIYYAGHGHLDPIEGMGFWVPVDGTRQSTSWIGSDRIKRYMGNMKAKHVLLVSDSCFAGDFFRERGSPPAIDEEYYRRVYAKPSRQVITSGGVEPVADSSLHGHSPFAYWLLDALGKNQRPYLVPYRLFDEIVLGVTRNARQTPRVGYLHGAQDVGGEYVLFLRSDAVRRTSAAIDPSRPENAMGGEAADELILPPQQNASEPSGLLDRVPKWTTIALSIISVAALALAAKRLTDRWGGPDAMPNAVAMQGEGQPGEQQDPDHGPIDGERGTQDRPPDRGNGARSLGRKPVDIPGTAADALLPPQAENGQERDSGASEERTYGGRKPSYGVRRTRGCPDRIEVLVYHGNKGVRTFLREFADDPNGLLERRDAFARSQTRAESWLAEVMADNRQYFEQGLVDFVFVDSERQGVHSV